jgi:hypothetical protein
MHPAAGVAAIVAGVGLTALLAWALWRRIPAWAAYGLAAMLGMVVGAGALLLVEDPGRADWIVTLGLLAALAPTHHRYLIGPPGRRA